MIVRPLSEVVGTDRDVDWGNGQSRRLLLDADGMGFAVANTQVNAGTSSSLHYRNHRVACYCISGTGELEVGGTRYSLAPGSFYAMDGHEPNVLHAFTEMTILSIFNPPITGRETHKLSAGGPSSY